MTELNEDWKPNYFKSKNTRLFQKTIVQKHYITYLQNACDFWEWEHDKAKTLVEIKEKEIEDLKQQYEKELTTLRAAHEEMIRSYKAILSDREKMINEKNREINEWERLEKQRSQNLIQSSLKDLRQLVTKRRKF
jgi:uncharacterized protein YecA (UPF0149 family)